MNRSFVIIDPDPIVTLDLVSLIKSTYPHGDVAMGRDVQQGAAALTRLMQGDFAFFNTNLMDEAAIDILNGVAARGGQIVFIGSKPDVTFPAMCVEKPFTSAMIMTALGNAASDPPAHPPASHT